MLNISPETWQQLDDDTRARIWAEAHKHDTTTRGEIVLSCQHKNRVGECDLCRRWVELEKRLSRPLGLERVIAKVLERT